MSSTEDIHAYFKKCLEAFDELLAEVKLHKICLSLPAESSVQRKKEQLQAWASAFGADKPSSSKESLNHKFRAYPSLRARTLTELRHMYDDIVNFELTEGTLSHATCRADVGTVDGLGECDPMAAVVMRAMQWADLPATIVFATRLTGPMALFGSS
ncbi:hypothetical protein B0J13DRAFT_675729 [Dactylonectria estremocensis]|uniref:Uncharacterized protein n=1 Tax=Dactylonectria estremocensis TaxID=1079267 RepID=A0A9P9EUW9_9HYPO|nr:hypothetical protein B0J13DRAFT_675729 [Dactylonectria estremocensis]